MMGQHLLTERTKLIKLVETLKHGLIPPLYMLRSERFEQFSNPLEKFGSSENHNFTPRFYHEEPTPLLELGQNRWPVWNALTHEFHCNHVPLDGA
jgi:hypothetical protein